MFELLLLLIITFLLLGNRFLGDSGVGRLLAVAPSLHRAASRAQPRLFDLLQGLGVNLDRPEGRVYLVLGDQPLEVSFANTS